jgi:hypothetical protein
MRTLILATTLALFAPAAHAFKPAWIKCDTAADCVKTIGLCGRSSAVNRMFQNDYAKQTQMNTKIIKCPTLPTQQDLAADQAMVVTCAPNKTCRLSPPGVVAQPATMAAPGPPSPGAPQAPPPNSAARPKAPTKPGAAPGRSR